MTYSLKGASYQISQLDPHLRTLIMSHPGLKWRRQFNDPYVALVRSIVHQQLSGRVASSIFERFTNLFELGSISANELIKFDDEVLRSVGLSANKVASIRDLSTKVVSGELNFDQIKRLKDGLVVERLVNVRGIGEWTAQMFLMFELRRKNVWPSGDLGVQSGIQVVYNLSSRPTKIEAQEIGNKFDPFKSTAAMWFWEALNFKDELAKTFN